MSTLTNHTPGRSPVKMLAEKMQMVRRDVKPGNGTSLMTYQNHESMKKHMVRMTPAVDAQLGEHTCAHKDLLGASSLNRANRNREQLKKENNRLFGRLLNIYEKKAPPIRDHKPGSLSVTKNKLMNAKITKENLNLGAKLMDMGSDVPD